MDKLRIDKWLWAVRIFKTRSIAADACKKGRVLVDGVPAKASREIITGSKVTVRKPPIVHSYQVTGLIEKRVSAKLVPNYLNDLTSIEELDKLKVNEQLYFKRDRGTGRPTKRERRDIDRLRGNL